jgi:hypothetical protein
VEIADPEHDRQLAALVAQVLDDLDEKRMACEEAIRAISLAAWRAGYEYACEIDVASRQSGSGRAPTN